MSNIRQKISAFFAEMYQASESLIEKTPTLRDPRAIGLKSLRYDPTPNQGKPWSYLSGEVYTIVGYDVSVVIAIYNEETILWLDNFGDDSDFDVFVQHENLSDWLPHRIDELLILLIETRFNYLGRPKLVRDISDILNFRHIEVSRFGKWDEESNKAAKAKEKQVQIAELISPPTYFFTKDKISQLKFCIWTTLDGSLLEINCYFGLNDSFKYEIVTLAEDIGR